MAQNQREMMGRNKNRKTKEFIKGIGHSILLFNIIKKPVVHNGLAIWPSTPPPVTRHTRALRCLETADLMEDTCSMRVDGNTGVLRRCNL